METQDIKEIAIQARAWAEDYQLKHPKHFPECLASLCAISSAYLSHKLTQNNIDNKIVVCDTDRVIHCFVICNDYIVDITATQFGNKFKAVEIKNIKDVNLKETNFWETTYIFDTPNELLQYQKRNDWFKEQRVDNCQELNLRNIKRKMRI
jgi:hypothetical protein